MMFDVTDTLLESFYAYTHWAIEDDIYDVEQGQQVPALANQEWTEKDEAIARQTTILLAS